MADRIWRAQTHYTGTMNDVKAMREYRRYRVKGASRMVARDAANEKRTNLKTGRGIHAPR